MQNQKMNDGNSVLTLIFISGLLGSILMHLILIIIISSFPAHADYQVRFCAQAKQDSSRLAAVFGGQRDIQTGLAPAVQMRHFRYKMNYSFFSDTYAFRMLFLPIAHVPTQ